ncbi:mitochondrial ribonuclease P catalytic subunit isoform X2 [Pezoporus wallicus]|uniref:mitochondrial ribonuclease P catalytic subunit isoform X2 n=1 Tax=Pezoporus wallicus TaxID=35540 RepID=UPI002550823A|nr:mitochondrial ribonuclease P catalytic subunit isoform X2 [Pezoporus wallicus]XP_061319503.1 mitochondrial ribonuclease P catalytic subunit isoform X2 [Pezoporus flaviventris]
MALFSQTSLHGFQALLWKCRMFSPVSGCPQLFAVSFSIPSREKFNCFSFMTSCSAALPVDPKGTDVIPSKKRSEIDYEEKAWDKEAKEISEGKLHSSSSVRAPKKRFLSHALLKRQFINVQPPEKPLQAEEWNRLRESFQSPEVFEEVMLNSMVKYNSPIDVAKSLLTYVAKSSGDIEYKLLVKYLILCVQQRQTSEILDVHDIMKGRFKILESGAYSLIIRGLSNSDQWRMALTILEEVKKIMIPSRIQYESCIKAASRHQEMNLAFELYHEMLAKDLVPTLDVLQVFFDFSRGMKGAELQKELFGVLSYLRENQLYPHKTFMWSIKLWFESIPERNWKGHLTNIKESGQCPVCNRQLEDSSLTEEEYNNLREKIIRDVIHGTDTFRKTSPQLFNAVNYLAKKNTRLLVLGRKHMLINSSNWKREIMEEMQHKAHFFFAENISEDDAFLLYATLRSGKHCKFVTRDFLRDHKACLSDSLTRHLFRKWQRGCQIAFSPSAEGKHIHFSPALRYDCVVQTTGDTWHIPYKDFFEEKYSYQVPRKWLCIQQK